MKHDPKLWLWRLPALLWMAFIWSNSLQPATQSAAQSLSVLEVLSPLIQLLPSGLVLHAHHLIRKLAHAFEFAVLGILWHGALSAERRPQPSRFLWAWAISGGTALADECIQRFVPGRSGQLSDVLLDASGALCGILLSLLIQRLWRARRS